MPTTEVYRQVFTDVRRVIGVSLAFITETDDTASRVVGHGLVAVVRQANEGMVDMDSDGFGIRRHGR